MPFNDVATYRQSNNFVYNILVYLINNNEIIWKLLKYNTNDALDKDNLTTDEKMTLVYDGTPLSSNENITPYRVFLQEKPQEIQTDVVSLLCFHEFSIIPTTSYYGKVNIGFDIMIHLNLMTLDDLSNRAERIRNEIIETLNQAKIGGITTIEFSKNNVGNRAVYNDFSTKYYRGFRLLMSATSA